MYLYNVVKFVGDEIIEAQISVGKGATYNLGFAKIPTNRICILMDLRKGFNKPMSESCAQGRYFFREREIWADMRDL